MSGSENYFQQGLEFYRKKDYKKSLQFFLKNIEKNPFHHASYFYIGRIHLREKNYKDAFEFFQICQSNEKDNIYYNLYLGRTLIFLKEYERSIPFLTHYQRCKPEGNFFLGIDYFFLNDFERSINYFKNCPVYFQNQSTFINFYSLALFNLGNIHYASGNTKVAKEFFLQSIEINKLNYISYFQLGSIFMFEGDYENALIYFEHLFNIYKNNESLRISLIFIYTRLNNYEKLESILLKNASNSFQGLNRSHFKKILALTLFKRKKFKEAIPLFIQLHKEEQVNVNILYYLAKCRYLTGDSARCAKIFDIIFDISYQDINVNNFYLLFLIRQRKYTKAYKFASFLISKYLYDNKTILYYYYVSIFSKSYFDFDKFFLRLNSIYNNNEMFLESTGFYYFTRGKLEKSLFYYNKLYKINPNDQWTILKLIELYSERNFRDKELILLKELYEKNPENAQVAFYYSYQLVKECFYNEAVGVLRRIKVEKNKAALMLSDIYFISKNNSAGFGYLKKSFLLNPLYLPVQFKSLVYFYRNANYIQAIRICKLMEYSNPEFKRKLIYEAIIYAKKSRYDLSIVILEKYLKDVKDNNFIKMMLANCYYCNGMIEQAKIILLHLMKIRKEQGPYLTLLALCYRRDYKYEEEKVILDKLSANFGKSPSFLEYKSKYLITEQKILFKRNDIGLRIP